MKWVRNFWWLVVRRQDLEAMVEAEFTKKLKPAMDTAFDSGYHAGVEWLLDELLRQQFIGQIPELREWAKDARAVTQEGYTEAAMSELLRIYAPEECGGDGYPFAWHHESALLPGPEGYRVRVNVLAAEEFIELKAAIKDVVRGQADHRCERCGHPYPPGIADRHPRGEWTPCDDSCTHAGPMAWQGPRDVIYGHNDGTETVVRAADSRRVAQWRILTVHHLNGVKYDCRWWNLAALCQRCHLAIQGRVVMERVYPLEHTAWFKPHAAGWYAADYLGQDLTRSETLARLDELLALERSA